MGPLHLEGDDPLVSIDNVTVRWAGKRQFVGWDAAGHGLVLDAAEAYGGEGTGPRPITVVLYGLAACTAMDVVSVLEKKRQDFSGLEIEVVAEQREDDYPKIYTRIELTYVVTGRGVSPEAVARAIQLSEDKYCSVKGMLGPQVEVVTCHRIVEEADPAHANGADG